MIKEPHRHRIEMARPFVRTGAPPIIEPVSTQYASLLALDAFLQYHQHAGSTLDTIRAEMATDPRVQPYERWFDGVDEQTLMFVITGSEPLQFVEQFMVGLLQRSAEQTFDRFVVLDRCVRFGHRFMLRHFMQPPLPSTDTLVHLANKAIAYRHPDIFVYLRTKISNEPAEVQRFFADQALITATTHRQGAMVHYLLFVMPEPRPSPKTVRELREMRLATCGGDIEQSFNRYSTSKQRHGR